MTITICGSMKFYKDMWEMKSTLEKRGFKVLVPMNEAEAVPVEARQNISDEEIITAKIEYDFIREHFRNIEKSDAVLILNFDHKGIPGYIGGNTFLEMGYAFGQNKKIYLLNPVPDMDYKTEMHAMQPMILNGDIS